MNVDILLILFFISILLMVQNLNNPIITALFIMAVVIILQRIQELRKKGKENKTESFMTDNTLNTELTSPDSSIISQTNLLSGTSDFPQTPSKEYVEGKKFGVNETSSPTMPMNPEICLTPKGRDAVDYAYGVPMPKRGTNIKDVIELYDQMQGDIDSGMATVMSQTGKLAKDSFTNRSRMTKRAFSRYFQEELSETANKGGWWDSDGSFGFDA